MIKFSILLKWGLQFDLNDESHKNCEPEPSDTPHEMVKIQRIYEITLPPSPIETHQIGGPEPLVPHEIYEIESPQPPNPLL